MLVAKERALLLALSETEYCTSGTLAKALGVSSKTAQGMVKDLREKLQQLAEVVANTVDLDKLLAIAQTAPAVNTCKHAENRCRYTCGAARGRGYRLRKDRRTRKLPENKGRNRFCAVRGVY